MVKSQSIDKYGRNAGKWSEKEDNQLRAYIQKHGHPQNWRQLPKFAGLNRCGKSCRLRWENYLDPKKRRGNYSPEEEDLIIKLHQEHGNKWSLIASKFPGRTDNDIKNHCHTDGMRKKMAAMKKKENSKALSSATKIDDTRCQGYYSQHNMDYVSYLNFNLESSLMATFTSSDPARHIDKAPTMRNDHNNIDAAAVPAVAVDQTTYHGSTELVSSFSSGVCDLQSFDELPDLDWLSEDELLELFMKEPDDDYFSTSQPAAFAMAADSTFRNIDGDRHQQFPATSSDEEITALLSSFSTMFNDNNLDYQFLDLTDGI